MRNLKEKLVIILEENAQMDKRQDIRAIVNQLKNADVFSVISGRRHDSFDEQFDMFHNTNLQGLHKLLL